MPQRPPDGVQSAFCFPHSPASLNVSFHSTVDRGRQRLKLLVVLLAEQGREGYGAHDGVKCSIWGLAALWLGLSFVAVLESKRVSDNTTQTQTDGPPFLPTSSL